MNPQSPPTGPSYWELSALQDSYYPADSIDPDVQVDLAVVGAGLVGIGVALEYKRKHPAAEVVLLEQTPSPANASTRNAGFACFGTVGELLDDLTREDEAVVYARVRARYEGLLHLRTEVGDAALHYEPCGGYEIFTDREQYEKVAGQVQKFNSWMAQISGEHGVYEPVVMNGYSAIFNRLEGAIHSGYMYAALLQKLAEAGVRVRWGQQVEAIVPDIGVQVNGRLLATKQVALCSNAHTAALLPGCAIAPGRGYVFVTEPLPAGSPVWHGTFHYDRGYVYYRHVGNNQILLGGGRNVDYSGETTLADGANPIVHDYLVKFAEEVLKLPEGWRIAQAWSGIMGFTEEHSPVVREVQPGVWLASGLGGMGVALGLLFGKQAAERIVSR